ncbi:unnamed protein product [Arctia plantaginis]|uniref:Mutator-like transposase domain-containing protein n=1 Tax=Arctia plantaginis TaxID=874455 RepID=A0A8S0ZIJ1_ARCPL|nr:unnamed protein product [Arctia plantaginis]
MPRKINRETRRTSNEQLSRRNKRKNVFNPKTVECDESSFSASAKKFKAQDEIYVTCDTSVEYRILNFITVFTAISEYVLCKTCREPLKFETASERGLGFKIVILCDKFSPRSANSCNFVKHSYEINRRFIFVMRTLGLGLKGATQFCGLMDMPAFLLQTSYDMIVKNIHECVSVVTDKLLKKACVEEMNATSEQQGDEHKSDLTVSGDGTWKKRGFTSLFGVTSLIGYYSGKIIDLKALTVSNASLGNLTRILLNIRNGGKSTKTYAQLTTTGHQEKWKLMLLLPCSNVHVQKYQVRFRNYIGDGDSKTYSGILKAAPYGETEVTKKECIGHVQKRMGKRLRDIVNNTVEEMKDKNGKKKKLLGGKGKLIGKLIDKLTVYYGLAIRRHCDSVDSMYKAIWASYFHNCSTDKNPQHDNCPIGENSWCSWQKARALGTLPSYKHDYEALPPDVATAIFL